MKIKNRKLYWALIGTFTLLYLAVAFVSTLHAITFFQLSNKLGMAILLGSAYEIGQAAVLFSILMTENKNRLLSWLMMFLLTALQITANVYASFKFMDSVNDNSWTYWQRSILFWIEGQSPEMYKVIISWISGALLPLVALGMTALVADNIRLARGEVFDKKEDEENEERENKKDEENSEITIEEKIENEVNKRLKEKNYIDKSSIPKDYIDNIPPKEVQLEGLREKLLNNIINNVGSQENTTLGEGGIQVISPQKEINLQENPNCDLNLIFNNKNNEAKKELVQSVMEFDLKGPEKSEKIDSSMDSSIDLPKEEVKETTIPEIKLDLETTIINPKPRIYTKKKNGKYSPSPTNRVQGWHLMKEFVDNEHNVFQKGVFVKNDPDKIPTLPKKE
ncbi:MAG: hypothetical protein PHF86_00615 [Candidatus Nanoarchaeia archaeon]|nr:hypothetical protein [Candidatus Nanoarchaeia archaeon]